MKKLFLLISVIFITSTLFSQSIGWTPFKTKITFNDSVRINKGIKIGAITLTTTATELNIFHNSGLTSGEIANIRNTTSNVQTQLNGKAATSHIHSGVYEPVLGNPSVNGYVLASTTGGTRSWVAAPSGGGTMTYPGAGIALSTGSAWGTSITNNSANWNTAYGWGNHAGAGYFTGTSSTIRGLFSATATGLTYTSGTGVLSLTSGYTIPSSTNVANWNTAYGWGNHSGLYLPLTGGTVTGTVVLPSSTSIGSVSSTEIGYVNNVTSSIQTQFNNIITDINDSTQLYVHTTLRSDTIPLFVFGGGGGNILDTATFNTTTVYGSFYNDSRDTLVVTALRGIIALGAGSSTIGVQVSWHSTFKSGSATNLNSSAFTVNSTTTGSVDTSFANDKIPPNVWVWCTTPTVAYATKPSYLSVTLIGYKK